MTSRLPFGSPAPSGQRLSIGSCVAAALLVANALPAQAQTAPATQAASAEPVVETEGLQQVTVTARYQQESLQKTPIAISATTNEQLKSANVTSMNNLGTLIPNLFTTPPDADEGGVPTIVMRGVSQNDASFARAPAVAIYIDDIYHTTAVGSELNLFDVDRIEVDRGPQSTLSGNASIGGAIKLYTAQPKGDDSGYAEVGYGSFNEIIARAAYDTKITDTLFARVSGHFHRQDGYVTLLDFTCEMNKQGTPQLAGSFPTSQPEVAAHGCKTGEEGGGTEDGARLKVRWIPTEKLEVNFGVDIERTDDQDSPELITQVTNPYPNSSGLIQAYNVAIQNQFGVQYDNRFLAPAGHPYSSYSSFCRPLLQGTVQQAPYQPVPSGICYPNAKLQDSNIYSAKVDYQITDKIKMTAIGSYSKFSDTFAQNGDESPLGYVLSNFNQEVRQRTGELRFTGNSFTNLDWTLGAFFDNYTGYSDGFIGYITDNFNEFDVAQDDSLSGFFHVDYRLTSKWRVSGGARLTTGSVTYHFNHPGLLQISQPFEAKEHRWDWLLSTDYQFTDDILGYATVSTGSRPPGITTIVLTAQQMQATPAEDLTSYEMGVKTEWFDHHVRANLAAFYSDYKSRSTTEQGVQCLGELPGATWKASAADCTALYPANPTNVPWYITVGTPAKIEGVEWDVVAQAYRGLQFEYSGGYINFRSGVNNPGAPGYIHPGNHQQPDWSMHGDVQYAINTPKGVFTPKLDVSWQSQVDFDPAPGAESASPAYTIKPYALLNGQIGYTAPDGKWSSILSVTNLTNKFYYYQLFGGGAVNVSSNVAPPREVHFTIRRDF
jgi:iron complex outermembrane recepter protein